MPADSPPVAVELECFDADQLDALVQAMRSAGYDVIAPTLRDGAIVYDEIRGAAELPAGWTDTQEAGHYRVQRRADGALFGYTVGPQSWKRFLHVPRKRLWSAKRKPDGDFAIEPEPLPERKLALLGVRACELAAIEIQDRVFLSDTVREPNYAALRANALVVTVSCTAAAPTCFCVSMGTGPRTRGGDLSLTEVVTTDRHYFVIMHASERGTALLRGVRRRAASDDDQALALAHEARAEQQQRTVQTEGLKETMHASHAHPHWDQIAERCLSCANCTMVCPTCFCSSVEDVVDVTGDHAERWQRWDSCFTGEFSHLHGTGSVRSSIASRYRQWLTHKLGTWHAQFDSSGCVGCGRCITWCPVGIDFTEELVTLRRDPKEQG